MGRVLQYLQSRHLDRCFRVAPAPTSELLRALFIVIFKRRSRITIRLFSPRLPWMKSCRAAVISLANFSGSEDRNNPGCRRSTGMNQASVHTRHIGGIGRGFGMQGKVDRLWPDIKYETNYIGTRRNMRSFFISLQVFFTFLSLSFFHFFSFLFLLPVAPRRCRDVAGWLAPHINKIVATFANVSRWLTTSGNEVDARTEDYGN